MAGRVESAPGSAARSGPGYNRAGETAGAIATTRAHPNDTVFCCVFPLSMLDLVPVDFDIEPLGRAYIEQGLDEQVFAVSFPRRK